MHGASDKIPTDKVFKDILLCCFDLNTIFRLYTWSGKDKLPALKESLTVRYVAGRQINYKKVISVFFNTKLNSQYIENYANIFGRLC